MTQLLLSTLALSSLAILGAHAQQTVSNMTYCPTNITQAAEPTKWRSKHKLTLYFTSWSQYDRQYFVKDYLENKIDYSSDTAYAFFDLRTDSQGNIVPQSGDPWGEFDRPFNNASNSIPPFDVQDASTTLVNGLVLPNATTQYRGNFGQFMRIKCMGKSNKFTISLGGWTWSRNFSDAVRTPQARQALSTGIMNIFRRFPWVEGVNFDWEYLSKDGVNYGLVDHKNASKSNIARPEDQDNFYQFLTAFKAETVQRANEIGGPKVISLCAIAAPEKAVWDPAMFAPLIDELHIMTYDFADGNWQNHTSPRVENQTRHHANLYDYPGSKWSVDQAVKFYLGKGFPANKILIGAAYYSRGFNNSQGLMTLVPGAQTGQGDPDMTWERGVQDYKVLPRKESGVIEYYDYDAAAAFTYDWNRKIFVSYDNVMSVIEKCNYVKRHGLLGLIVWEASGDHKITHPRSLTKALYDCFHN